MIATRPMTITSPIGWRGMSKTKPALVEEQKSLVDETSSSTQTTRRKRSRRCEGVLFTSRR
jgi:hypothetical protein